jgi:hypothetical protein
MNAQKTLDGTSAVLAVLDGLFCNQNDRCEALPLTDLEKKAVLEAAALLLGLQLR